MTVRIFFDMSDFVDFIEVESYDFIEGHLRLYKKNSQIEMIPIVVYDRISISRDGVDLA